MSAQEIALNQGLRRPDGVRPAVRGEYCRRAADGDVSVRLVGVHDLGDFSEVAAETNRLLGFSECFVEASVASVRAAGEAIGRSQKSPSTVIGHYRCDA